MTIKEGMLTTPKLEKKRNMWGDGRMMKKMPKKGEVNIFLCRLPNI